MSTFISRLEPISTRDEINLPYAIGIAIVRFLETHKHFPSKISYQMKDPETVSKYIMGLVSVRFSKITTTTWTVRLHSCEDKFKDYKVSHQFEFDSDSDEDPCENWTITEVQA